MAVPNRPTTGQKATITRGLNLQAATKKDVQLLSEQIGSLEKQLSKIQKEIIRAVKRVVRKRGRK
jgi:polyhydroxyalkanoate synthesis regulator phasin